jgi:ribonuclease Z
MESPYFPIALNQMPGNIIIEELKEMHFSVGAVTVEACFVNHPGVCVGYRLRTSAGSVVYMPDNETFGRNDGSQHGEALPCRLESHLLEFISGADVLICDSQYNSREYHDHIGWGHGCVDEVVRLAAAANVGQLFLFHHDPAHDDQFITELLAHARKLAALAESPMRIEAAREGEQIVLKKAAAAAT